MYLYSFKDFIRTGLKAETLIKSRVLWKLHSTNLTSRWNVFPQLLFPGSGMNIRLQLLSQHRSPECNPMACVQAPSAGKDHVTVSKHRVLILKSHMWKLGQDPLVSPCLLKFGAPAEPLCVSKQVSKSTTPFKAHSVCSIRPSAKSKKKSEELPSSSMFH